jgi:hypothetical protein
MLKIPLTCKAAFPHAEFSYTRGVLHSENDSPALIARAGFSKRWLKALYLAEINEFAVAAGSAWSSLSWCSEPGTRFMMDPAPRKSERRWYVSGDLRRETGRAVIGDNYWYDSPLPFHRSRSWTADQCMGSARKVLVWRQGFVRTRANYTDVAGRTLVGAATIHVEAIYDAEPVKQEKLTRVRIYLAPGALPACFASNAYCEGNDSHLEFVVDGDVFDR